MVKYVICIICILYMFSGKLWADDFVPRTEKDINRLVNSIYKAEGGDKTKYPYGIKSVKCDSKKECRRVCRNTIVNNVKRWEKAKKKGDKRDYLTFLWHRYCPPKAHKLNNNWLKNVKYFLNKGCVN